MSPIPPDCSDCACSGGDCCAPDGRTIYSNYLYDSSLPPEDNVGNTYTVWSELMTHISMQEGPKSITFINDETIPAGAYDFRDLTLRGDFTQSNIKVEFPTGMTITDWTNGIIAAGLLVWTSSALPIYEPSSPANGEVLIITEAAAISSTAGPMIRVNAGETFIAGLSDGGSLFNANAGIYGGFPVIDVDPAAATAGVSMTGTSPYIQDDVFSGTGNILRLGQSVVFDPSVGLTQPNLVGSIIDIDFTFASALRYDQSLVNLLVATDVQAAIDENATYNLTVVNGPVSDLDFATPPPDGTRGLDSLNEHLYVRVNGAWKYTALI